MRGHANAPQLFVDDERPLLLDLVAERALVERILEPCDHALLAQLHRLVELRMPRLPLTDRAHRDAAGLRALLDGTGQGAADRFHDLAELGNVGGARVGRVAGKAAASLGVSLVGRNHRRRRRVGRRLRGDGLGRVVVARAQGRAGSQDEGEGRASHGHSLHGILRLCSKD